MLEVAYRIGVGSRSKSKVCPFFRKLRRLDVEMCAIWVISDVNTIHFSLRERDGYGIVEKKRTIITESLVSDEQDYYDNL